MISYPPKFYGSITKNQYAVKILWIHKKLKSLVTEPCCSTKFWMSIFPQKSRNFCDSNQLSQTFFGHRATQCGEKPDEITCSSVSNNACCPSGTAHRDAVRPPACKTRDLFVGSAEVFNHFCFGLKSLPQIQIVLGKLFLPCVDESFVIKCSVLA